MLGVKFLLECAPQLFLVCSVASQLLQTCPRCCGVLVRTKELHPRGDSKFCSGRDNPELQVRLLAISTNDIAANPVCYSTHQLF